MIFERTITDFSYSPYSIYSRMVVAQAWPLYLSYLKNWGRASSVCERVRDYGLALVARLPGKELLLVLWASEPLSEPKRLQVVHSVHLGLEGVSVSQLWALSIDYVNDSTWSFWRLSDLKVQVPMERSIWSHMPCLQLLLTPGSIIHIWLFGAFGTAIQLPKPFFVGYLELLYRA